ncbi:MAG: hypothetical protein MUE81_12740 [Thermoflexibacter sp.]|jgi:hypothetical protein|nr:hypothetical protein [Thermoflexibacter sp.]
MKIKLVLSILFCWFGLSSFLFAQTAPSFKGTVDYGDYAYLYEISPLPKQTQRYSLKINALKSGSPSMLAYQSILWTEGKLERGQQYKVLVMFAEKVNQQWKSDPTSHVEIVFDLADNLMKHSNRGMIAKKEAAQLTDVLSTDLASEDISQQQAIDFVMQFLVINYNQLFGEYAISNPIKQPITQLEGKRKTVFVSANDATGSFRDTVSLKQKHYAYQLTEVDKEKYSLEIRLINQGNDIANEELVYSSEIQVDNKINNKDIYSLKILYAKESGYAWRTTSQSFLQVEFNFQKKLSRYQVFGKMKETQTGKFAPITKFTDKHQYTQKDMLDETVRFFVKNFNKMLLK